MTALECQSFLYIWLESLMDRNRYHLSDMFHESHSISIIIIIIDDYHQFKLQLNK